MVLLVQSLSERLGVELTTRGAVGSRRGSELGRSFRACKSRRSGGDQEVRAIVKVEMDGIRNASMVTSASTRSLGSRRNDSWLRHHPRRGHGSLSLGPILRSLNAHGTTEERGSACRHGGLGRRIVSSDRLTAVLPIVRLWQLVRHDFLHGLRINFKVQIFTRVSSLNDGLGHGFFLPCPSSANFRRSCH